MQHSVVDGTWWTACISRPDLFPFYRVRLDLQNAENATRTETYFTDSACVDPSAELKYRGTYELIVTARDFIYGIDFVYAEQAVAALNVVGQEQLEQSIFCGVQQWPLAKAQSPLDFDPRTCTAVGPMPLKNFNLVQINQGQSLNFAGDLTHEDERPIDFRAEPQLIFLSKLLP